MAKFLISTHQFPKLTKYSFPNLSFSIYSGLYKKTDKEENVEKNKDCIIQDEKEKTKSVTSELDSIIKNTYKDVKEKDIYRKKYNTPLKATTGILKDDLVHIYENLKATPIIQKIVGPQESKVKLSFPSKCDILIIGGGIIGASIAYHLQKFAGKGVSVVVVEKDQGFELSSTVLSIGGIRQQFSLPENIQLSRYGFDFLRTANKELAIPNESPPNINMNFGGYLTLASEDQMKDLLDNYRLQKTIGTDGIYLTKNQIKRRFPWIQTDGIEGGIYGIHGEGWFDPWSLLCALTRKCRYLGTEFVHGEVIGSSSEMSPYILADEDSSRDFEKITEIEVMLSDGECRSIQAAEVVLASGCWSGGLGHMLGIGKDPESLPLPVVPRKRYVYVIESKDGPVLNCPLVINPDGIYFRREGLANVYLCGGSPSKEEEPPIDDLSVDESYFNDIIWPSLAKRVPAFNALKLASSWAGFYDYNLFDQNGFFGRHPIYSNLHLATGFSGHGLQHGLGIGKAFMEKHILGSCQSINLERFAFERMYFNDKLDEKNIV